jgi:tetraacyldisaccharide 4'-kinase
LYATAAIVTPSIASFVEYSDARFTTNFVCPAKASATLKKISPNFISRSIFFLYRLAWWVAAPAVLLWLALRVARHPNYHRHLAERFGFLPRAPHQTPAGGLWLHAVSVGEVLAAIPFLDAWRSRHPGVPVWITCTTVAGRQVASERLASRCDGIFYAPLEYSFAIRSFLRCLRPRLLIVMETEIWPNLWYQIRRTGRGLAVVNGRISDRTAPTYLRHRWFFRHVLSLPHAILAQSELDRTRYLEAGAPAVANAGNLKFDFDPSQAAIPPVLTDWLNRHAPSHLFIAASTVARDGIDEDDLVLAAFDRAAIPNSLLILAPRKPERFDAVAAKLATRSSTRRSTLSNITLPGVLVLDSIGELSALFTRATAAFVGGSVAPHGGHNVLEPIACAVPVATGSHMANFRAIHTLLLEANAIVTVHDAVQLAAFFVEAALGQLKPLCLRAQHAAASQFGATRRALEAAESAFSLAVPRGPDRAWLRPLSAVWFVGGSLKRRLTRPRRLPRPVVSIGNLTLGGTGKTPLTLWILQQLAGHGRKAAVLTRGYGRADSRLLALAPGAAAPVSQTGDEPQLYLRQGFASVAIGADRYAAAQALPLPDLYLLDDGFQHAALHRDLDIVLLDAEDPFGQGHLFPAGWLREPPSALRRAHIVILTRTQPNLGYVGLRAEIHRYNPQAILLQARHQAVLPQVAGPVAAFCGLARPASFLASLRQAGANPIWFQGFPDHYRYRQADLNELSVRAARSGAVALWTTEKDFVKLSDLELPTIPIIPIKLIVSIDQPDALLAPILAQTQPD